MVGWFRSVLWIGEHNKKKVINGEKKKEREKIREEEENEGEKKRIREQRGGERSKWKRQKPWEVKVKMKIN